MAHRRNGKEVFQFGASAAIEGFELATRRAFATGAEVEVALRLFDL